MCIFSRAVIIGCAGMGNRLGLGMTKALVEVDGNPLIIRHLEQLDDEEDIHNMPDYSDQLRTQICLSCYAYNSISAGCVNMYKSL